MAEGRNIQLKDSTGQWNVYPITVANEVKYDAESTVKDKLDYLSGGISNLQEQIDNLDLDIDNVDSSKVIHQGTQLDIFLDQTITSIEDNVDGLDTRVQKLETNGSDTVVNRLNEVEHTVNVHDSSLSSLNEGMLEAFGKIGGLEDFVSNVVYNSDTYTNYIDGDKVIVDFTGGGGELLSVKNQFTKLENRITEALENSLVKIERITQAEYDNLSEYQYNVLYVIKD